MLARLKLLKWWEWVAMIVASPLILAVVVVLLPGAVVIVGLMTLLGVLEGDKE